MNEILHASRIPDQEALELHLSQANLLAGYDLELTLPELVYELDCEQRSFLLTNELKAAGYSADMRFASGIPDGVGWHIVARLGDGTHIDPTFGQHVLPFSLATEDGAYGTPPPLPAAYSESPFLVITDDNVAEVVADFTETTYAFITEHADTALPPHQLPSFLEIATAPDGKEQLAAYYTAVFHPENYGDVPMDMMSEYETMFA